MYRSIECYLPVIDTENSNGVGLTIPAKDQVNVLNANAIYTSDQVKKLLINYDRNLANNSIFNRLQFIGERVRVLSNRAKLANDPNLTAYIDNIRCALNIANINFPNNAVFFPDWEKNDVTAALDYSKVGNLIMLYAYEVIQLGRIRSELSL